MEKLSLYIYIHTLYLLTSFIDADNYYVYTNYLNEWFTCSDNFAFMMSGL